MLTGSRAHCWALSEHGTLDGREDGEMASMVPAAQLLIALGFLMAGIGVVVWAGSKYPQKKA
jgi:hypothetical protein